MGLTQITTGGVDDNINIDSNTLKVDGTNNRVGIGTSSPSNVLHVHQTDATSNSYVHITQADGGSGATDGLSIGIEDGGVNAAIRNRENGYLRMFTNNTERLRIDANGELISVRGSFLRDVNTGELVLAGGNATNAGANIKLFGGAHASTPNICIFRRGSSESMRIDSSGRVGIGTTSPATDFHIHSSSGSDNSEILLTNGDTGATATDGFKIALNSGEGGEIWNYENDYIRFGTNNSERMRIDSSGNVGIGKSSSGNKLEIEGQGDTKVVIDGRTDASNGSDAILELWSKNSSGTNNFGFIDYDGDGNFEIGSGGSGAGSVPLVFKTNGSERMRIDSSGRLLVGGTASTHSDAQARLQVHSAGATNIVIARNDSTISAGNTIGMLQFYGNDGGTYQQCAEIRCDADGDHANNDKPSRLVFGTTADGASSASERMRITQSGTIGMGGGAPMSDARLTLEGVNDVALAFKRSGSGKYDSAINCDAGAMIFKGGVNGTTVSALNELMRIDSSGNLFLGASSPSPNATPRFFASNTAESQHTSMIINGNFGSNFGKYFEAKGKSFVRNTAERNIDLVQSINAVTNINVLVKFTLLLNCATDDEAGEVTGTAGFHKTGGNPSFWTNVPSITHYKGSGMGSGSLQWVGGSATEKILRYTTDSNRNYTRYIISSLEVTGHDFAPIKIL